MLQKQRQFKKMYKIIQLILTLYIKIHSKRHNILDFYSFIRSIYKNKNNQPSIIHFIMTSQLFQQFFALLQESNPNENYGDVISYQILIDQIYFAVQNQLKFFTHRFDQVLNMYYALFQNYQTQGINLSFCSNLFQIFVMMVQRRPSLIKKHQDRLLIITQKLLQLFNSLDFQVTEEWMRPHQGYSQEQDFSEESNLTKQIMSYFDRIAKAYTYPQFIKFFNGIIPGFFNNAEGQWKSKYTLIMVMSQLAEDIQQANEIKLYVDCAINSSNHPHPKVRYGVLQMIGQYSDDLKPGFQQAFGGQILPVLLNLSKDQVPRVQGHVMACLTNFLQDYQQEYFHILAPYIDQIISISQGFAMNGISIVKQNTVSALASLSSIDILNDNQIQKIMNIINYFLTDVNHQGLQYRQLVNQTVQCLSMILFGQKAQKIQKYLPQTINVMKSLKDRISHSYFVNSWSRLCLKYKHFTDLSEIFPYVLITVTQMIESNEGELQSAIGAVSNTLIGFEGFIKPYANDLVLFCKNGIQKLSPEQTKQKSLLFQLLSQLTSKLKSQAPDPQWQQLSRSILTFLLQQIQAIFNMPQQQQPQVYGLQCVFQGLQGLIQNSNNLFSNQQIIIFSQKLIKYVQKLNAQIFTAVQQIQAYNVNMTTTNDEIDVQEYQSLIVSTNQYMKSIYQARLIIPDIFQSTIKKTSEQNKKLIADSLYFNHFNQYLQTGQKFEDIRYGMYYLCNLLDVLGYEGIQQHVNVYQSKFCQFAASQNIQVRNTSVYGLGVFMQSIPVEKTNQSMIYKWLNILWNSLSISHNSQNSKKQFDFARDNIVSALGKLIISKKQYYPAALNQQVIKKWFENLPVNTDKVEGNIQHQILLTLLQQSPQLFITSKQDIVSVLKIFAKYLLKRTSKKEDIYLKNKMRTKQYLSKMNQWPIFQQNSDYLWNNLHQKLRNMLTKLMTEP